MKLANTATIDRDGEDDEATIGGPIPGLDLQTFLSAVGGLLHDTVARFEETVGRVTEIVMTQRGRAGPELIVTLQEFDRLQQELMALGNALTRYAAASDNAISDRQGHAEFAHVITAISVGDLRDRFLSRLEGKVIELFEPLEGNEEIF